MRTLTGLSGECVTFDQNGPKCRFSIFEFLAANLPNLRFWRNTSVIGTISQTVKVKIFWCFEILKIRSMTSYFWERSETAILAENRKKNTTTLVAIARTTRIVVEKQRRIAEVAETAPSCNYCVATIAARPLRTTVKGGKPAFRKENKILISPILGIRRGLGTGTFINLYKLLASLSFPELNLINIWIHFVRMRS